ncbi:hypothetical protein GCM10009764_08660 [Nocardia ninae]|uniref:Uncharacterized protein n=1 Tax=Nocardia ninae NBRC 108245 TaxID=1210091 RepID=A0A511MEW7_9NOCA|nr:hypothetical protein NN4_37190 [Nocardia ninae NBRC 108245]
MRELARHLLRVILVVPQIGICGLVLELVDTSAQLLDVEDRFDRLEGGVEFGEISGNVRMHGGQAYWFGVAAIAVVRLEWVAFVD